MPNFPLTLEVYPTEADTRKVIETSTETLFRSPWWIRPHWSIFNWAEFDFRPMSLFQIGALRYLKGILCKRLKKKNVGQGYFEKKICYIFYGKETTTFLCIFSVHLGQIFREGKKGKLMYLGIQFLISRRKLTFLWRDSKSHLLKGSKTFPYLHEPNTANVSK